jgi:para-aminobenzoate synthetase/4-amino-4-deoxychorismate lyase
MIMRRPVKVGSRVKANDMRGEVVLQIRHGTGWLRFTDPVEIVEAHTLDDVLSRLHAVESAVNARGWYAAGFLTYEAAPAFDRALRVQPPAALPLLWFGLYDRVERVERPTRTAPRSGASVDPDRAVEPIADWAATVTWPEYERSIHAIKHAIAAGDTYQVNYTYRLRAPFRGEAWPLFLSLARKQPVGYAAYVDTGRHVICSASPELFFHLSGRTVTSKPMKGTAPRGRTLAEDRANQQWLHQSEKNRAENVMIVDMVRNDLGRIAEIGSVDVPQLFAIERYPTVLQMTSTVTAQTDAALTEIMTALFPCASITGAPTVRTMDFIAELETTPRGVYTGCIGYLAPEREAQFNVAIRTVTIDRATGQAEYGVGGGIVWDSDAADEFRECQIKTRVLTQIRPAFDLIESILWTPDDGCFLVDRHRRRLADSAEYFDISIDWPAIEAQLEALTSTLPHAAHKLQVRVSPQGVAVVSATPLGQIPLPHPMRVTLAARPIDSNDPFLYHKTTRRDLYAAARAARPGYDDVILWNERGEITEATIANVVVEFAGELVTPPIECGLLPGTFRGWLLDQGVIRERVISLEEFKSVQRIYLINSVRKWIDVVQDETTIAQSSVGSHQLSAISQ